MKKAKRKATRAFARTKKRLTTGSHKLEFRSKASEGRWITRLMGSKHAMMREMLCRHITDMFTETEREWRVVEVGHSTIAISNDKLNELIASGEKALRGEAA